ncbi:MAG TPA: hypothetical protein VEB69_12235 [Acidimicrobiia bacterium]|nr:hypothetical protein [Acidimicrobiia bacterium]
MTHRGQAARRTNRVLIGLVVLTIAAVAFWAANGGLEEIPGSQQGTAAVSG